MYTNGLLDLVQPQTTSEVNPILIIVIPAAITLVGGLITQLIGMWNRRRGAVEAKGPTVDQSWKQADTANLERDVERDWRRDIQDAFRTLRAEVRAYIRVVTSGGPTDPPRELTDAMAADPKPRTAQGSDS